MWRSTGISYPNFTSEYTGRCVTSDWTRSAQISRGLGPLYFQIVFFEEELWFSSAPISSSFILSLPDKSATLRAAPYQMSREHMRTFRWTSSALNSKILRTVKTFIGLAWSHVPVCDVEPKAGRSGLTHWKLIAFFSYTIRITTHVVSFLEISAFRERNTTV